MSIENKKILQNPRANMPKKWSKKFIELLYVQASSKNEKLIYKYLVDWLDERGITNTTDAEGNILVTKGKAKSYPVIVAHMDTVHTIKPIFDVESTLGSDNNTILYATDGDNYIGIGGDDKNGIFAVLYMLEKFDNLKAVFFTKEEVGCVGSKAVDHSFFNNCGYILQLDRWGSKDFICSYWGDLTVSDEFINVAIPVLDKFKYEVAEGLMTDSITLYNKKVGISCVNISCGYYLHHSNEEEIDLNEFWHSIKMTEKLIKVLGEKRYEHLPPVKEPYIPQKDTRNLTLPPHRKSIEEQAEEESNLQSSLFSDEYWRLKNEAYDNEREPVQDYAIEEGIDYNKHEWKPDEHDGELHPRCAFISDEIRKAWMPDYEVDRFFFDMYDNEILLFILDLAYLSYEQFSKLDLYSHVVEQVEKEYFRMYGTVLLDPVKVSALGNPNPIPDNDLPF